MKKYLKFCLLLLAFISIDNRVNAQKKDLFDDDSKSVFPTTPFLKLNTGELFQGTSVEYTKYKWSNYVKEVHLDNRTDLTSTIKCFKDEKGQLFWRFGDAFYTPSKSSGDVNFFNFVSNKKPHQLYTIGFNKAKKLKMNNLMVDLEKDIRKDGEASNYFNKAIKCRKISLISYLGAAGILLGLSAVPESVSNSNTGLYIGGFVIGVGGLISGYVFSGIRDKNMTKSLKKRYAFDEWKSSSVLMFSKNENWDVE
jgi:hypothetical protein